MDKKIEFVVSVDQDDYRFCGEDCFFRRITQCGVDYCSLFRSDLEHDENNNLIKRCNVCLFMDY